MISKHVISLLALFITLMVVTVPFASAAGGSVERQITMEIDSVNESRYNEVVNLGDPNSAATNPSTWNPTPSGIWLGASTEESLFSFHDIMREDNFFNVFHEVIFNSTQIMNGASVTIIRSPINMEGVVALEFAMYRLTEPGWDIEYTWGDYGLDATYYTIARMTVDITDYNITGGSDSWIKDDRLYIELHCPIYSGVDYVFHWNVVYAPEASPTVYLTSQDVANDGLYQMKVGIVNELAPDDIVTSSYSWDVEPGISYDMLNGLGNNLYAESIYVHSGDNLTFQSVISDDSEYYHTLMVPFVTEDHTLDATVTVHTSRFDDTILWQDSRTDWYDYILSCSDTTISGEIGAALVNITFNEDVRINLMFFDLPEPLEYWANQANFVISGVNHTIYARPWASYQLSLGEVLPPSIDPYDWPELMEMEANKQQTWFGTIIGTIMIVVGAAAIATGIGIPLGAALIAGGVSIIILEEVAHGLGYQGLPDLLSGVFTNIIDAAWDALSAVGDFLWSIGESIYDAIVWFIDAVVEYGSVLLGLLIIGVALALFFIPIYAQLKLWGIIWSMAKGKLDKAVSQAQDLYGQAQDVVGKVR